MMIFQSGERQMCSRTRKNPQIQQTLGETEENLVFFTIITYINGAAFGTKIFIVNWPIILIICKLEHRRHFIYWLAKLPSSFCLKPNS